MTDLDGTPERAVIFVNDDEDVDRKVTEKLEHLGYAVHLARNAQDALRIIQAQPRIDLVLFNIEIAVAEGADELLLLKNMHPNLPVVPACPIRNQDHERREAGKAATP